MCKREGFFCYTNGIKMKKLNILIVVTRGDLGGAQSSVLNLAKALHRKGHIITVAHGEGSFLRDALREAGISFVKLKHLKRTYNPITNVLYILELKKYVDSYRYQIIHFNSSNALLGALGAKLSHYKPKTVFTVRGLSLLDAGYTMNSVVRFFHVHVFKLFFAWIDSVVFVSKHNKRTAIRSGLVKKGAVVANGVDIEALGIYNREKARKHLLSFVSHDIEDAHFLIGSIGRLAYQKNYEFLINVFPSVLERNADVQLVIIGEGPEREAYETLIRSLRLEHAVHLIGGIEFAAKYAKAFDVFVLPSRYEGMSITALEMLCAGIPMLVTTVAGNDEIVSGDGRQLFELNNEDDFLEKLSAYMQDPKRRSVIAEENQTHGELFHISKTAEGYEDVYRNIMKMSQ